MGLEDRARKNLSDQTERREGAEQALEIWKKLSSERVRAAFTEFLDFMRKHQVPQSPLYHVTPRYKKALFGNQVTKGSLVVSPVRQIWRLSDDRWNDAYYDTYYGGLAIDANMALYQYIMVEEKPRAGRIMAIDNAYAKSLPPYNTELALQDYDPANLVRRDSSLGSQYFEDVADYRAGVPEARIPMSHRVLDSPPTQQQIDFWRRERFWAETLTECAATCVLNGTYENPRPGYFQRDL